MKKGHALVSFKWVIVLFFVAVLFSTCANASEKLELLVPGELSVATEGTYPPFSMVDDNGNLYGLEISVVKEICNRLGLEYKPVMIKWESILVGLLADKYDMISAGMDITEERQAKVTFANGWLESGGTLIVPKNSDINKVSDIKGKTIGCLVASTWAEIAKDLGAAEVKFYKAESDNLQDLVNGATDGVVTDAVMAAYAIEEANLPLRLIEEKLSYLQKGFAIKMGKPNLVRAINKALAEMAEDGTYERLTKEIVGINPYPEEPIKSILD